MNDGVKKIIKIEWYDSFSLDAWQRETTAVDSVQEPMLCHTIGWFLCETDDIISVCHSFNDDNQVCGVIQIPKCSIKGDIVEIEQVFS